MQISRLRYAKRKTTMRAWDRGRSHFNIKQKRKVRLSTNAYLHRLTFAAVN
jgi:hypothetical protein